MAKPKKAQITFQNCFECVHEKDGICMTKYNDMNPQSTYAKAVNKTVCETFYRPKQRMTK